MEMAKHSWRTSLPCPESGRSRSSAKRLACLRMDLYFDGSRTYPPSRITGTADQPPYFTVSQTTAAIHLKKIFTNARPLLFR